jgi:hypothetical protein
MVDKDHTPVSETAPASGAIVFCKQKNTLVAVPFIGQMDGSSVEPHYKTGWRGAGILKKAGLDVELTPCEMNTVDKWSLFAWPLFENTTARKATATARFILLLDPNQNERPISPRIEAMKRLDKKIKRVATYILTKHGLVVPLKQP